MNEIQSQVDMGQLEPLLPGLARDLAQNLYTIEELIEHYSLTEAAVRRLLQNAAFRNMVQAAKTEWQAPGSARQRAILKAQLAVEEAIPTLYGVVTDNEEPGSSRVAAFAQLKEIGQFPKIPPEDADRSGPTFSVTINLGNQSLNVSAPHSNVAERMDGALASDE